MKFGFCGGFDEKELAYAKSAGFDGIEMFLPNQAIPEPAKLTRDDMSRAREAFDRAGVSALTVFHYEDYADPDPAKAKAALAGMKKSMDMAEALGTKIVTCNAWVPGGVPFDRQLAFYRKTFGALAKRFEDRGMKLAIENCPHGLRNIAYSPWAWERIFDAVPSKAIGLEFDPSHFVYQFIDGERALYEFADRVYAFHAKDMHVYKHILERRGVLGGGWVKPRIPGFGDIDWTRIFLVLAEIGYDGPVVIEHEDPFFSGARREEGLTLGLRHLKQFVV